jgi:hypothetical protein
MPYRPPPKVGDPFLRLEEQTVSVKNECWQVGRLGWNMSSATLAEFGTRSAFRWDRERVRERCEETQERERTTERRSGKRTEHRSDRCGAGTGGSSAFRFRNSRIRRSFRTGKPAVAEAQPRRARHRRRSHDRTTPIRKGGDAALRRSRRMIGELLGTKRPLQSRPTNLVLQLAKTLRAEDGHDQPSTTIKSWRSFGFLSPPNPSDGQK